MKPVQVEALKNYSNLSNVTQFSVISIMNDALPKKSKESKLSFQQRNWINIFHRSIQRKNVKYNHSAIGTVECRSGTVRVEI